MIGIGGEPADGKPHDGRAPNYDDWTTESENGYKGLNGDILDWDDVLGSAFELSSMALATVLGIVLNLILPENARSEEQ
mgnify:CR=1 FL=1